jgi:Fungal specific transcription factor domain
LLNQIPTCRDSISRAHSALVGAAIRLAECMGLHRDPSEYGHPPVETHVRRLIWYQLCFLDLRTAEVQGPRASIRNEDYSTRFPLNLDDEEFTPTTRSCNFETWTEMTFTCIRFECQEMTRIVLVDRTRVEKKLVSLTHVLGKIESFRKAMYAKYGPLLNTSSPTPIQRNARATMSMLINKLYTSVLHRYHTGVAVRIPDRLRQVLVTTGAQHLEDSIELETAPDLQRWAWYSRAYHQFHVAILLLIEVFFHPTRREADRIWRCLDYVYETPSGPAQSDGGSTQGISRPELMAYRTKKARMLLTWLRDRMAVYRTMRKVRLPAAMIEITSLKARQGILDHFSLSKGNDTGPVPEDRIEFGRDEEVDRITALAGGVQRNDIGLGSASPELAAPPPPSSSASLFRSIDLQTLAGQKADQAYIQHSVEYETPPVEPGLYQSHENHSTHDTRAFPISPPDAEDRGTRGTSYESDAPDPSIPGLWFAPGASGASAGTALRMTPKPSAANRDDLPVLDIDWVCTIQHA